MDRRKALKKTGLLAGATVALPTLFSLLESCKEQPRLTWQPEFFTDDEAKTISALVNVILPKTDTPGALDVKVDLFIDKVMAQTYTEEGQQQIRDDIEKFNFECSTNFGDSFFNLNETDKAKVIKASEASSGKFNPGIWGTTIGEQKPIGFYRSLKSMAIWAYFTSEEIGENVLSYDPVPGDFKACIPVSEVGNRWSL